jgi:tyrosine-protein kinase Etk/Wzc
MTNQPTMQPFSMNDDGLDAKRYLSLFISNWYWFAISLFISLSFAYSINRWSDKVYTVSSTLLIKDDKFGGANADLANIFPGTNTFRNQQNLKNEIGILKSFNLNYRVIQKLPYFQVDYIAIGKRGIVESRMYNRCPFIVKYDSIEKQKLNTRIGIKILSEKKYRLEIEDTKYFKELNFGDRFNEGGFDFTLEHRQGTKIFDSDGSNRYSFYFNNLAALANAYRSRLSVNPIEEDASLVTLTTSGFVPQQEADYLNKLMEVYIEFGLELKNQTAGQTLIFIDNQLNQISDSLKKSEATLENFRLTNKLIDLSKEGGIIQDKLSKIDGDKSSLQLKENYFNYLKDYIRNKQETSDIISPSVMGVTDELLIRLVSELSQLQEKKRTLAMNLFDGSEPLKNVEKSLESMRSAINENIENGLQDLLLAKKEIENKQELVEIEAKKLPTTERQMINIQRGFDINNTIYTFLLEKRAEAGIAKASNVPDNRIIDHASFFSSSRIRPREKKNFMLAFLLGTLLPLLSILLIDYLNNKIIDKKDIERGTKAPILGFISHNSQKTEIPLISNPGSTLAESFRSIRTNLKYFLKNDNCPVISISSTITGEGKTFISANLAVILAMSGKKILLMGLDLRKPRIHKIFGISNETGMSNYLVNEASLKDVVVKTEVANLWYASSGPIPPNPAELIDSDNMKDFIFEAKKEFDYIVIDTPPVAIVTDALLVSAFTDFYIFVIRQRYSSKSTLDLIEELHKSENIKSLGVIINDISVSGYYGYGLRYGYSMGYGYSYGYNYYSHNGKYGYYKSADGYYKEDV